MPQQADDVHDLDLAAPQWSPMWRGQTDTLGCVNDQCRVVEYRPHSSKAQDQKCPACYGSPL